MNKLQKDLEFQFEVKKKNKCMDRLDEEASESVF